MARPRKLPKVLTAEEQDALLVQLNPRYVSPHRNLIMLRLMLATGLRAGEVVALRPEHLDMRTCKLIVREGKGARDRVLWISEDLRDEIGEWLERRPESPYLFPTRDGSRLSTRYLRHLVSRLAERAGIAEAEKVSPHTLRHTFATDLYRETKNLRLVQKALGHASIQTTETYTHIVDEELEEALRSFRSPKVAA
jgi:site-specific recombinase XerD